MPRRRKSQRGAGDPKYRRSPFAPAAEEPLLARVIPVTKRLSGYGADAGRRDLVAGLTVAALAVPSGMAYAELAGLSPVNGLYALVLPSVAYALLASSRQVIVGPEGVLAALIAAVILPQAAAGSPDAATLGALLGLFTGALFLLARVARLGWIADYLLRLDRGQPMSGGIGELASGSESGPCRGSSRLARWRLAFDELG